MREYEFELRLCAHLEGVTDAIVARQLGGGVTSPGGRVLDIVLVDPGPEFDDRAAITAGTIPPRAIESDVGVGRASRWPPDDSLSPRTAERVRETAVRAGFFEPVRRNGRDMVRQTVRYPDWFGRITAIENKPALARPGELEDQLRHDVALGLVDEIVLATGSHVTRAHLNRIPDEVGVWRVTVDPEPSIDVVRAPTRLDPTAWGIEVGDREPLRRRIQPIPPAAKRRARVRIAERAYGGGWRPALFACEHMGVADHQGAAVPTCGWKDEIINPGTCDTSCPGYEPGSAPDVDYPARRADRTPWRRDPSGVRRTQTDLTRFAE